jgi:GntR family transcriptional regulator, transcriptional repressor for pyruvate dehydrogenase complex
MTTAEAPAKTGFATIPRNKVYQAVAQQLERHIREELKPGDLLPPERQLVQMLGVSRGSIRDAIRSLEMVGLLEPRQGVGTVVCDLGATSTNRLATALRDKRKLVAELIDVRKMIEPPLVRRAALHASGDELAEMEEILKRQAEKVRRGELAVEEDSEFHYSLALASSNSAVLRIVDVLMDLLRETREQSLQGVGRQESSLAGHRRILAALKRRDADAAELAMERHLLEIENIALKKL